MYTLELLRRKIAKEGREETIRFLLSEDLPLHVKQELEKVHVFNNGYLCLSLIHSL